MTAERVRAVAWNALAFTVALIVTPVVYLWALLTGPHELDEIDPSEMDHDMGDPRWN